MKKITTLLSLPLIIVGTACTDFTPGGGTASVTANSPSLTLGLRHAPQNGGGSGNNGNGNANGNNGANISDELQSAVAIVHAASAHVAGSGWHVIFDGRKAVDFLNLNESADELGFGQIPAGKVTQIRLFVLEDEESYVVAADGTRSPMLTPSGSQSGIKIKGTFNIGDCEQGRLTLATDRHNAIHIHGRGGNHGDYILRPVIRVADYVAEPANCDNPEGGNNPGGDNPEGGDNPGGDNPEGGNNPGGDNPEGGNYPGGDNPEGGNNPGGDNPEGGDNPGGDIPEGGNPEGGDNPEGDIPDGDSSDGEIPAGCVEVGDGILVGSDCVEGSDGEGTGGNNPGNGGEPEVCFDPEGGLYEC